MIQPYFTAIIGGGASGLACAVEFCRRKKYTDKIIVLEGADRVGKKLLATGNGQGNLSNNNMDISFYHGDKDFLLPFIKNAKSNLLKDFFNDLGIYLTEGEEGKLYPMSRQANSVLDAIRSYLEYNGVKIKTSFKVNSLNKKDGLFVIKSGVDTIYAKNVICAFGGKSGKQFLTDGTSYSLLSPFNNKVTELYPSLVQLKTEKEKLKGLKGIKEVARVSLLDNKKVIKECVGDVLFTDYGLSGNAVFKLSGYTAYCKNPVINIEFLPNISTLELQEIISQKLNKKFIDRREILTGLVNKMTGKAIISTIKDFTAENIARAIKNFSFNVIGTTGFDQSQVTKGGIDTRDIDSTTFRNKLCENMYIVGEALNVDGDCGGYNLTFAFISAIMAVDSIIDKN